MNVERLPISETFWTMMSMPDMTGRLMRLFLKISMSPLSTVMREPSGILGSRVTLSAFWGSILRTLTFSPMVVSALVLVRPSMRMRLVPSSSLSLLNTLATAVFLPVISMMSPIERPSLAYASGSRRARPYPASLMRFGLSTFMVIDSAIGCGD